MDYSYSEAMNTLLKKKGNKALKIFLISAILFTAAIAVYIWGSSQLKAYSQLHSPESFDPGVTNNASSAYLANNLPDSIKYNYSSFRPQYISSPFAHDAGLHTSYCFAFDANDNPCIVAIDNDKISNYQELIDYAYDTSAKVPDPVVLKGMPQKIDNDLAEIAVEALNSMYDGDIATTASYSNIIGSLYLNTVEAPLADYQGILICIIMIIILLCFYGITVIPQNKYSLRQNATLEKFSGTLLKDIDNELLQESTVCFKMQDLYITDNYLITGVHGLDIIPLNEIIHVYGSIKVSKSSRKQTLIAITSDNTKHVLAESVISKNQDNDHLSDIINALHLHLDKIPFGLESGFYIISGPSSLFSMPVQDNSSIADGNLLLGIAGSMIGALLGGFIWILIGKMGFIAGIAGFVMIIFSMHGYTTLSGSINKKGQIISVIVAMLMIFVANYTLYALELISSRGFSIDEFIRSCIRLPKVLTSSKIGGLFIKDLVIGYLLSLWSCFRLLSSVFKKTKPQYNANARSSAFPASVTQANSVSDTDTSADASATSETSDTTDMQ